MARAAHLERVSGRGVKALVELPDLEVALRRVLEDGAPGVVAERGGAEGVVRGGLHHQGALWRQLALEAYALHGVHGARRDAGSVQLLLLLLLLRAHCRVLFGAVHSGPGGRCRCS